MVSTSYRSTLDILLHANELQRQMQLCLVAVSPRKRGKRTESCRSRNSQLLHRACQTSWIAQLSYFGVSVVWRRREKGPFTDARTVRLVQAPFFLLAPASPFHRRHNQHGTRQHSTINILSSNSLGSCGRRWCSRGFGSFHATWGSKRISDAIRNLRWCGHSATLAARQRRAGTLSFRMEKRGRVQRSCYVCSAARCVRAIGLCCGFF